MPGDASIAKTQAAESLGATVHVTEGMVDECVAAARERAAQDGGPVLLLDGKIEPAPSGTTVAVLSGGNVDAGLLAAVARRHETESGRRLVLLTRISDRPGGLAALLTKVAETGANLVEVSHVREGVDLHVRETAVELILETRGPDHADAIRRALDDAGYDYSAVT